MFMRRACACARSGVRRARGVAQRAARCAFFFLDIITIADASALPMVVKTIVYAVAAYTLVAFHAAALFTLSCFFAA